MQSVRCARLHAQGAVLGCRPWVPLHAINARHAAIARARASDAVDDATRQQAAYHTLVTTCRVSTMLEMRPGAFQNGLFTTQPVAKGQVMMEVPAQSALIIDYNKGVNVPQGGKWPRLKEGLAAAEPLPWDLLLALAMIDGLAGDGGTFWQGYTQAILPAPETLTLPMCWSRTRLDQLQHSAIVDAALAQQDRLMRMFPDLMDPIEDDCCSWLQWAFACVRSRAYKLGQDSFAMVPFWDLANHAMEPNGDFRVDPAGGGMLQLFALADIPADTEVFITYTGPEGYTNQRLMAQYGFVIPAGNQGDRIAGLDDVANSTATQTPVGLSLERFQLLMGDDTFLEVVSGRNAYAYAALKSLPVVDEPSESRSSDSGGGAEADGEAGAALALELLERCGELMQEHTSSLDDDEAELSQWQQRMDGGTCVDARDVAAVAYRVERKRLLKACVSLLELYSGAQRPGASDPGE